MTSDDEFVDRHRPFLFLYDQFESFGEKNAHHFAHILKIGWPLRFRGDIEPVGIHPSRSTLYLKVVGAEPDLDEPSRGNIHGNKPIAAYSSRSELNQAQ